MRLFSVVRDMQRPLPSSRALAAVLPRGQRPDESGDPSAVTLLAAMLKEKDALLTEARRETLQAKDALIASLRDAADARIAAAVLRQQLQAVNVQLLIKSHALSIRASIETLMAIKQPSAPAVDSALVLEYKSNQNWKENHLQWTKRLNVEPTGPPVDVAKSLYSSVQQYVHGRGIPFSCNTGDKGLSPAEWALLISFLETELPKDSFKVFDPQGNEIMISA